MSVLNVHVYISDFNQLHRFVRMTHERLLESLNATFSKVDLESVVRTRLDTVNKSCNPAPRCTCVLKGVFLQLSGRHPLSSTNIDALPPTNNTLTVVLEHSQRYHGDIRASVLRRRSHALPLHLPHCWFVTHHHSYLATRDHPQGQQNRFQSHRHGHR